MAIVRRRNFMLPPNWLDDYFNDDTYFWPDVDKEAVQPEANLHEEDDRYVLEIVVPGMKREDLRVEHNEHELVVGGQRSGFKTDEQRTLREEFAYVSFERKFGLPSNSDHRQIQARYEHGVLHVEIPKRTTGEASPTRSISIE